jgi:tetratricopeptide (TPR) repeat protein
VAYVEHQWAKLLLRSGEPEEAARHLDAPSRSTRRWGIATTGSGPSDLRTQVLEALGRDEEALANARENVERARRLEYACVVAAALLDLGRLLLRGEGPRRAVEVLRQSLASADMLRDRRVGLYAHTRLWKAYLALGEREAAAMALRQAADLVGGADEASAELDEVRPGGGGGDPARGRSGSATRGGRAEAR